MRIVVDAMGSDKNPVPDVAGAVLAAREWREDTMILAGHREVIEAELAKHDTAGLKIEVVHADEVVEMTDKPSEIMRSRPRSSMHVGIGLVKDGQADAFVTAGNTGAALAVALFTLKRIAGVHRPALTAIFPNLTGYAIMADFGANAECKPEYLLQFAQMASIYTELAIGLRNPRVALLSNGEEEGKGNTLVKETAPLLKEAAGLNFIGNVEPKELLMGHTDIVVHDGFTGNVMGKSIEAAASLMGKLMLQEIKAGVVTSIGGLLAKPALHRVAEKLNPDNIGGIPLLGVNGVVIIGHGRSNAIAIRSAIRQARRAVEVGVVEAIRQRLAEA
ncbi:MAG: phosphate acyltransferase PlsX [Anaerolineae bacterium]|nr:phosphate acyltransferase PlsX [Anaerolineae bacterium]